MSLASRKYLLQQRALCLQQARAFFSQRQILEVDTPILSKTAPIDEHIDIMPVSLGSSETGYLHSSPEYAMKRLLAEGLGNIFQLSHVFRQGEIGIRHNPEFTMAEWYRLNFSFSDFVDETLEFLRLFLGNLPSAVLSYKTAFMQFTGLDYRKASADTLFSLAEKSGIALHDAPSWNKESLLHLIMGTLIEPHLGSEELLVLTDYPPSQAALAQLKPDDEGDPVAKRFEVYYKGIELANGYLELTDAAIQEQRLLEANTARCAQGKDPLPLDQNFLAALRKGLPPCCGVAVGFDRVFMLKYQLPSIDLALPFSWNAL